MNENAKMLAIAGEIPEINHNQIVGWLEGTASTFSVPLVLRDFEDEGLLKDITEATISILDDKGFEPIVIDLNGGSHLKNEMMAIILGDFVSYYLAMLQDIDPTPVSSIGELKKRMG